MSTACSHSSEETTEQGGGVPVTDTRTAISFSGQQGEEQAVSRGTNRRAGTPLSDTGVHAFTVWGYKNMSYTEATASYGDLQTVFPGYIVNWTANSAATTTTNSNGWEYISSNPEQTIKYWDWGASAYRFFAVTTGTPSETAGQVSFTMTANASPIRDGEGTAEQKIAANIAATPYFSKLWFSTGNVGDYPDKQFGKPVQLEFLKPFARVRFLFNYSYAPEGVKLTNISFKPTTDLDPDPANHVKIARKGTVKVTYPLTGTATSESYTVEKNANPAVGEELTDFTEEYIPEGTEKWYTVFPVDTQGSYTMSVTVDKTTKTAVVPAEYMSWKPGYSYTYIFKITEQGGVEIDLVQTAVTSWTEFVIDHTVYNW